MKKKLLAICTLLGTLLSFGQYKNPLQAKDSLLQSIWVDSILKSMTVEEKIGQLFMVQAYSNKDDKHKSEIRNMIKKYHVGNLIFMQGTPERQVVLNNAYQREAKIPLLIGFDGEWGLDMRLKNSYRFPWNMTLGAISNNALLKETGRSIGEHCKRVGIHINFAPVVDINTNPSNPIIGNRSFGESRENVAFKGVAFTEGMQSVGVLASAKHFPGHGDTEKDSHKTLPTVDFSPKRLDSIELYPYDKMFAAGVASVMVAHLSMPQLEPNKELPSSLSKNIVTDLLQRKMGFRGLVITDGLNMKGAANYSSSAAINLAAFQAGNDILLIPQDIPNTVKLFKDKLKAGELTEERIDVSVTKILQAKYLVGLSKFTPIKTDSIREDIYRTKDELLHRKLLSNAITVLKNEKSNLPLQHLEKKKIAYVPLGDDTGNSFFKMLKNYTKVDKVTSAQLNDLLDKLKPYTHVIIGFHKSNKHPWKSYKFTNKEMVWLQEIARDKNVILDVFTSPYCLHQVKSFTNIESIVVSYQNSIEAQELSAQGLFGAIALQGKLPVSILEEFKVGEGLLINKLNILGYTLPEEVGLSSSKLAIIDKRIDTILAEKMAPGGQVLVARHGKVVYNKSFGYHTNSRKRKVKNSDVYDLASLTKILASLPMVMKAEEEKKISLYSTLGDVLSRYKDSNKDTLMLKEILSHYARLKAWIPFYIATKDEKTGKASSEFYRTKKSEDFSIKVASNLYLANTYRDSIYHKIVAAEQRSKIGYKYSDLGYYMLQEIIEHEYNEPLNVLVNEMFYKRLGANRTSYLPLNTFSKTEIVPTENDTYYRNQLVHGYVHDMGAAMLGGVGGHAGLFSNANDVAKIMQMYLQNGSYDGYQFLQPETIAKFNQRYYADKQVRRGLGFDKVQIRVEEKPTCGCVSEKSFGHSGFTGTYAWADPESDIVYVFLSNRVFPTMSNRGLVTSNMRTKIQEDIQNAILEE
ncbi:glycoside hydrolase family 3 N-terminal domain-containing protein [Tenacibaculum sp. SG-28]|uniref:glycoside hydrolase family 3 N-terminal domain-containing protein n=1 Tax=Tenacibaculum sp. SG-28 TaxID=754426 RepID=UPI000CF55332|nr:glycoside hydrolase family 3 N-terminal domain-containing protein [Tenacibaculum sp. SG-28]PQJ23039.1 beta-N-acetylglucosaminidase [Tenacibaculum sp. SG-28]